MAKINKSKNLSAGVSKTNRKAPMVDPRGAWTKVQERTIGNMNKGGKVKKGLLGLVTAPLMLGAASLKAKSATKKLQKEAPKMLKMMGGMPPVGMEKGGKVKKAFIGSMIANKMQEKQDEKYKSGGTVKAKGGKWIQKAINPKHKGYCTPTTKKTCTPKRKALAMTLKKMAKARKGK
jgi:hypothetical protein